LFGAGISLIGMSLSFPICMGVSTALGTLVPMLRRPSEFITPAGMTVTLGIAVLLAGVILVALAGLRMEMQATSHAVGAEPARADASRPTLWWGLCIATLAGICDPFLNFAFAFGEGIKEKAVQAGATAGAESDAIWAVALMGSFVINAIYCARLLVRNQTWTKFREAGTASYWLMAAIMGIVWMVSITLYGRGASMMGRLGGSVGWAIFYSSIIIFSMLWGIVCGEWREGRGRPLRTLFAGLAVLMVAVAVLAKGNALAAGM
jgi:L-rhamnose-H+ transport protein